MSSDVLPARTAMTGRAGIAMLTLQLRAAEKEAAQAEAAAVAAEQRAAQRVAAAQPDPLVEQRTAALAAALTRARDEAATTVAHARHEAAQIVAAASPRAAATPPVLDQPTPIVPSTIPSTTSAPGTAMAVTHTSGFDAEAFATVFATAFAAALEDRLGHWGSAPVQMPMYVPQPPKRSFWAHAKHLDVALLGLAATIIVVVMFAWMG